VVERVASELEMPAGSSCATGLAAGRDARLALPAARRRGNLALKAGTLGLRAPWCSASRNGGDLERQREYAHDRLDDRFDARFDAHAPVKCATLVSMEITKSICEIKAAVSAKSSRSSE
jgi:hypothetical protein